jgi:dTDP-4-dehydrorhamnose 3,5-epimerase
MQWTDGPIEGCVVQPLTKFADERGWLAEFFRHDELSEALHPAMGYLSLTYPGVARGPHEHADQTDLFVFFSGTFRLYLWDARAGSPTRGRRQRIEVGESEPTVAIVPPGVVHAYRNVGRSDALIMNCPNRLYAGYGKKEPVDEIRHEDQAGSPFILD